MLGRNIGDDADEPVIIDLSSMIDCVFILLIFFIVSTVFVEETGVEVDKPEAGNPQQLEKQSILLAITAKNQIVYDGKEIGIAGVRPLVSRLTMRDEMPVIIQADAASQAGILVRLIDECKLGGAKTVSLAANKSKS